MALSRYILLFLIQLYAVSAWSLEQNGSLVGFQSGIISHDTVNGRMRVDLVQTPPNSDSSFYYEGAVGSHLPALVKNKEYRLDFRLDRGASPLRRLKVMLLPSRMLIADISAPSALLTVDTLGISDSVSFRFAAVDSLMSVVIVGESSLSDNYYYIKDFELLERQNQVENTSKKPKGGQPYTERSRYRWGYNGAENLDEIKGFGNTPDLGDRWHDPRLGRMNWKIDRRTADYPWQSPYAYYGNSPISTIDENGEGGGSPTGQTSADRNDPYSVASENTSNANNTLPINFGELKPYTAPTATSKIPPITPKPQATISSNTDFRTPYQKEQAKIAEAEKQKVLNTYNNYNITNPAAVGTTMLSAASVIVPEVVGEMALVKVHSLYKSYTVTKTSFEAGKGGVQYTKSSLQLGQQMHKGYKVGADGIKEFRLPSGKRIDFLDINNRTIYELKPFNPRAMQQGQKQLNMYMQELQTMPQFKGINWKTVLDTY